MTHTFDNTIKKANKIMTPLIIILSVLLIIILITNSQTTTICTSVTIITEPVAQSDELIVIKGADLIFESKNKTLRNQIAKIMNIDVETLSDYESYRATPESDTAIDKEKLQELQTLLDEQFIGKTEKQIIKDNL